MEWVNLATVKHVPDKYMVQMEKIFKRLNALLADNYDPVQPLILSHTGYGSSNDHRKSRTQ